MFRYIEGATEQYDPRMDGEIPPLSPQTSDAPQPGNAPPPPPPLRFGAAPIQLKSAYDNIVIEEKAREDNISDFDVYIFSIISSSPQYLADLVTLLHTVSTKTKINIFISSPGGSLQGGARIAGAIAASKADITTIAWGMCGSAAALIWSYGKTYKIVPGSSLLFHMSTHGDYGQSQYIATHAENTVRYVKCVAIDPLVERGILTPDEAETILDRKRDVYIDSYTFESRIEQTVQARLAQMRTNDND